MLMPRCSLYSRPLIPGILLDLGRVNVDLALGNGENKVVFGESRFDTDGCGFGLQERAALFPCGQGRTSGGLQTPVPPAVPAQWPGEDQLVRLYWFYPPVLPASEPDSDRVMLRLVLPVSFRASAYMSSTSA